MASEEAYTFRILKHQASLEEGGFELLQADSIAIRINTWGDGWNCIRGSKSIHHSFFLARLR